MKSPIPLKTGDVAFVMHPDNIISKIIAWFQSSKWSHCFIVVEQTNQNTYLLETTDFEVANSTLDKYLMDSKVHMEVYSIEGPSDDERNAALEYAKQQCFGKVYGYSQFFSLGIRGLLKKVGIRIGNFIPWGWVCSEVVTVALTRLRIPYFGGLNPKILDAQDLYEKVLTNGWKQIYIQKPN